MFTGVKIFYFHCDWHIFIFYLSNDFNLNNFFLVSLKIKEFGHTFIYFFPIEILAVYTAFNNANDMRGMVYLFNFETNSFIYEIKKEF